MKLSEKTFSLFYVAFALMILAISWVGNQYVASAFQYVNYPYLLIYFALFTGLMIRILQKNAKTSPQQFVRTFLLITTVKLLLNGMIAVLFAFTHRAEAKGFLIFFLGYYLAFTVAEVVAISLVGTQKEIPPTNPS